MEFGVLQGCDDSQQPFPDAVFQSVLEPDWKLHFELIHSIVSNVQKIEARAEISRERDGVADGFRRSVAEVVRDQNPLQSNHGVILPPLRAASGVPCQTSQKIRKRRCSWTRS